MSVPNQVKRELPTIESKYIGRVGVTISKLSISFLVKAYLIRNRQNLAPHTESTTPCLVTTHADKSFGLATWVFLQEEIGRAYTPAAGSLPLTIGEPSEAAAELRAEWRCQIGIIVNGYLLPYQAVAGASVG